MSNIKIKDDQGIKNIIKGYVRTTNGIKKIRKLYIGDNDIKARLVWDYYPTYAILIQEKNTDNYILNFYQGQNINPNDMTTWDNYESDYKNKQINYQILEIYTDINNTSWQNSQYTELIKRVNLFFNKQSFPKVTINNRWFNGMKKLKTIKFSQDSVLKYISWFSFSGLPSLTKLYLPKIIEGMDSFAFEQGKFANTILYFQGSCDDWCKIPWPWYESSYDGTNTVFKNFGAVKYLNDQEEYESFINITLNVSYISAYAFYGCQTLKTVTIQGDSEDQEFSMGRSVFSNCTYLSTCIFPKDKNFTILPTSTFDSCHSLDYVRIPEGVIEIQDFAFHQSSYSYLGTSYRKKIYLPKSLTKSGKSAFYDSAIRDVCYNGTKEQWQSISKVNKSSLPDYHGNTTVNYNYNWT